MDLTYTFHEDGAQALPLTPRIVKPPITDPLAFLVRSTTASAPPHPALSRCPSAGKASISGSAIRPNQRRAAIRFRDPVFS
jgi:hypothetical protein